MGYLASIILLLGQWIIGGKNKYGFILLITGNLIWTYTSLSRGMYDLLIIASVNSIVSLVNFIRWFRSDYKKKHPTLKEQYPGGISL